MTIASSAPFSIRIATGGGGSPAWTAGKNNRQWYQAVLGTLEAVKPSPSPEIPNGKLFDSITVWSSGAVNQALKTMMIWGGGHSAYAGNEHYGYRLSDDAPSVARLNNPTPNAQIIINGTVPFYSDGRPVTCHSGDHIACDNAGNFWSLGLCRSISQGIGFPNVMKWAPQTDTWTQVGTISNGSGGAFEFPARTEYPCCAHDPSTNRFYFINQLGTVAQIDANTNAVSNFYTGELSDMGAATERCATVWVAPSGVRTLVVLRGSGRIYLMNLDNPAGGWTAKDPTGAPGFSDGPGIQWHDASGGALCWGHGTNRQNLWKLNPPTAAPTGFAQLTGGAWAWTSIAPLSGSVVPSNPRGIQFGDSSGTYKRFGIILNVTPTQDVVNILNDVDEQPYSMLIPSSGI